MLITTIVSILIGAAGLLLAYLRYIRLSPRLEIIELFKSSTESFDQHINDLEFSYKGEVYKEISSSEFLVANRSMRSIEQDDLTPNNPLEFVINGDGVFHEVQVIKKIGDSHLEFVKTDDKTISFVLNSMDRGSRQRVEILTSGTDYTIETKGKLRKANHSISRIKRIKGGFNISEIVENGLHGIRTQIRVLFLVITLGTTFFMLVDRFIGFNETRILAPQDYHEQYRQFVQLDSIQESGDIRQMRMIIEHEDSTFDTINANLTPSHWTMAWWGDGNSKAKQLSNRLIKEGHNVYYDSRNLDESLKYDEYRIDKSNSTKDFTVINRKYNWIYFKETLGLTVLVTSIVALFILIIASFSAFKTFRLAFQFRNFLTEEERASLLDKQGKYSFSRLLLKLTSS